MALRWDNVDLKARTLHLPKTKNGDPLNLPLSTFLAELLAERFASADASPYVFPGPGKAAPLAGQHILPVSPETDGAAAGRLGGRINGGCTGPYCHASK